MISIKNMQLIRDILEDYRDKLCLESEGVSNLTVDFGEGGEFKQRVNANHIDCLIWLLNNELGI